MLAGNSVFTPPAYEQISTSILTSSATSIVFDVTGLGSIYKHLQIRATSNTTSTGSNATNLQVRFNNDTASNYAFHILFTDGGSTPSSAAATTQSFMAIGDMVNTASIFSGCVVDILDFAATSKNKTVKSLFGVQSPAAMNRVALRSGLWMNSSAINTISLTPLSGDFRAGSRLSLYGIKG
jgi:hypothetical protein